MARYWYSYILPAGDPRLSSSYQLIRPGTGPNCTFGTFLCAVYSKGGGPFPLSPLSVNLQQYIASALANGIPQPSTPLGSKFFVYLKPSA